MKLLPLLALSFLHCARPEPSAFPERARTIEASARRIEASSAGSASSPRPSIALVAQDPPAVRAIRARAEDLERQGSYELARRAWKELDALDLTPETRRWMRFRVADDAWRALASTQHSDDTELEIARKELEALNAAIERPELRDATWARVEEALGDFFWTERRQDWGQAFPHYANALDWWAGAKDVEAARERYLAIVWKAASPERQGGSNPWWAAQVPAEILENAVRVAQRDEDKARAQYLFAVGSRWRGGDVATTRRAFRALESAVAIGKGSTWYDDALHALAQWNESPGRPDVDDEGRPSFRPDHVAALNLYRRYVEELPKGKGRHYDEAKQAIERITGVELSLGVPSAFLPGSEVVYTLAWRNATSVELVLDALDLAASIDLEKQGKDVGASEWLQRASSASRKRVRAWTHATQDAGKHDPGSAELSLGTDLAPGAYLLEATAGGKSARELVLVGRTIVAVKATRESALAWCCDALTSEPVGGAAFVVWQRWNDPQGWRWRRIDANAAADGTALVPLTPSNGTSELLVFATKGDREAVSLGSSGWAQPEDHDWRIYAVTDRPAYRPEDTVQWKITARTRENGRDATPANAKLGYEILDPRGTSVKKGELALNAFGSAWTELALDASMALGEYRVRFERASNGSRIHVGDATLFRLEEYKLPEFEVTVATPNDPADATRKKLYRLGDRVEADLVARTYFGAPVAGADVEVIVWQRPYWRTFDEHREYPWYYATNDDFRWGRWNQGAQIARLTAKTDAEGKARVAFDTPEGAGQDLEYTLEARVTDASRREITARGSVRVAQKAYAVSARTAHALFRPNDAVETVFEAKTANEDPVQADGRVRAERRRWIEVWRDPQGKELRDAELEIARSKEAGVPLEHRAGWRLVRSGYEAEEVASAMVRTDAKGVARWSFVAPKEGFYTVTWGSRDDRKQSIEASASFWVASEGTRDTGYRSGPVELVVDRDTLKLGEKAPVMVSTSSSNRWVLVTLEGERLHSFQVVHVEGTAKLVMLAIGEEHAPNFWLSALTATAGELANDVKELVVPPTPRFLSVEVTPDAETHEPGEEGSLSVLVKDARGEPVAGEVTLSLVDESVTAIQSDYAGDPRPFFHGRKRSLAVQTSSSVDQRSFRRFEKDAKGNLRDLRLGQAEGRDEDDRFAGLASNAAPAAPSAAGARGHAKGERSEMLAAKSAVAQELSFDSLEKKRDDGSFRGAGDTIPPGDGAVQVRSDFRATALWKPDLVTGADGRGEVRFRYPDTLTRWIATARAITTDTRVGYATATARTRKPLTARLQAPRFFVVGDECVVSALVDNQTDAAIAAEATLAVEGLRVIAAAETKLDVPAHGQARFDWKVRAELPGTAKMVLVARGGAHSDGMTKSYPVHAHGIDSQVARALRLAPDAAGNELVFDLDVPVARRKETTLFEVNVAPSLAVTMLDALPYLVDYPYGCTEQTMSRFLPAAIVARTLRERGISAEDAMGRVFGGIEVETAGKTHPKGKKSLDELAAITRASLERLRDMQHDDGGWGWWKEGQGDRWMTAYVVWGLSLARDAELDVDASMMERGARWLEKELVSAEDDLDVQAWMLHAIAAWSKDARESDMVDRAIKNLWARKDALNAYGRALYALACQGFGRTDRARTVLDNLVNGVTIDAAPDVSRVDRNASTHHAAASRTAHWGADRIGWRWTDSAVETTAFALRALATIDPKNELVEPVMTWLVQNRRGAQWSNTRDTAISILALDAYLSKSGELARDVEYELVVNGARIATRKLAAKDMLAAPGRFTVPARDVKDGINEVRVRIVSGSGPLYVSSRAAFFSLEEPVPARGSQLFAKRQYFRVSSRPTLLKGPAYDVAALADEGVVQSGDRIEVVLTLEAKNDLEYLHFEDLKPAGFEAVETKSGQWMTARELKSGEVAYRFDGASPTATPDPSDVARYTGRQRGVHQELRDRAVALFLDKVEQGVWEIRYTLRAEAPGRFHALPVLGEAMYVPEIRCNGAETRVTIEERAATGG